MNDGMWIGADTELESVGGEFASAYLDALSRALEDAPPDRRYDLTLRITERERAPDSGGDS